MMVYFSSRIMSSSHPRVEQTSCANSMPPIGVLRLLSAVLAIVCSGLATDIYAHPVRLVLNMRINTLKSHSNQTQYLLYHGNLSLRTSLNLRVLHIWWQSTITVIFMKLIDSQPFSHQWVIQVTKQHFNWHGIPHTLITDNGAQFTSDLFKTFAKRYQFNHITIIFPTLDAVKWSSRSCC